MKTKKRPSKKASRSRGLLLFQGSAAKAPAKRKVRSHGPLHRKIALHPMTLMVVLCANVFVISWTFSVLADNINVSAKVHAPALKSGAVITSPSENAVINRPPITVSGTCPNNSYVNLYSNNKFSGVAWCGTNNTFSIKTSLLGGHNALLAQDYNITDDPGPLSSAVIVNYTSPSDLYISGGFNFSTVNLGSAYSTGIQINGGIAPYRVTVDWGDGQSSSMNVSSAAPFNLQHEFNKTGYYAVIITATDSGGGKSMLQLAALVKKPGTVGFSLPATTSPDNTGSGGIHLGLGFIKQIPDWLKIAWPSTLIVSLMVFSFWLGERQEIARFRPHGKAR